MKIVLQCKTSGIRIPDNSVLFGEELNLALAKLFPRAWQNFCREFLGEEAPSPAGFYLAIGNGVRESRGHHGPNGEWYEWLWVGTFSLTVVTLASAEAVAAFIRALAEQFVGVGGGRSIGHGFVEVSNLEEAMAVIREGMLTPEPERPDHDGTVEMRYVPAEVTVEVKVTVGKSQPRRCPKGHFLPAGAKKCKCEGDDDGGGGEDDDDEGEEEYFEKFSSTSSGWFERVVGWVSKFF